MPTFTFLSENHKFGAPDASSASDTSRPAPTVASESDAASTTASKYRKNFRWGEYVPPTQNPTLNARSAAAEVPISHLKISAAQRALIEAMYHPTDSTSFPTPPIVDRIFSLDSEAQLRASAIMAQHSLDVDSREHIGSRWSQQWSRRSEKAKTDVRKLLYLCVCGYDHQQRNTKYDRTQNAIPGTQQRHTGAPFTGCLAHAEITVRSDKIVRIRGHFDHNDHCKTALFERVPPIPVHPSVYASALAQLRDGATFSDIRRKNRESLQAKAYKDFPDDLASSQFRWLLTQNDSRSLYRQYNRMKGVTVTDTPEVNVDDWLDPKSEKYNPTLAHAIFHYSARVTKGERFEVAIATDEMNHAAWTYGHESQIILDGTFGVCDSRLLLFIVMAVDENRKGVPIAFLLFSAPTGNKQTSAGYDTSILEKLLRKWSDSLNRCGHLYGFQKVKFRPVSAITDTDLKERGALIIIFPDIWLLICRFHLRQSWRNHRNKLLKGKSAVMIDMKHRMASLETALLVTQTIVEARDLLEAERQIMMKLAVAHPRAARKATEHIDYLDSYWTTENLWKSWSDYGRTVLASLLGRAGDHVIPTTNHLESFNRVLKRIHLKRWQNGGRRMRVDILIHALIIYILPSYQLREMGSTFADLSEYLDQRVTGLTLDERDEVRRGYGQLVNLMAKMERVLNLPAQTPALPPVDQPQSRPSAALSTCTNAAAATSQIGIKRKQILPPSPEKLQKRHQSHAIH